MTVIHDLQAVLGSYADGEAGDTKPPPSREDWLRQVRPAIEQAVEALMWQCADGHDFEFILAIGSAIPDYIVCRRCGETRRVVPA